VPELKALPAPYPEILNKLQQNHQTMVALGVSATPATFDHDAAGVVQKQMGLPQEPQMMEIMGPLQEN
jgi:protein-disulfide isomerase